MGCNYLSMPRLRLNHVSKRRPRSKGTGSSLITWAPSHYKDCLSSHKDRKASLYCNGPMAPYVARTSANITLKFSGIIRVSHVKGNNVRNGIGVCVMRRACCMLLLSIADYDRIDVSPVSGRLRWCVWAPNSNSHLDSTFAGTFEQHSSNT